MKYILVTTDGRVMVFSVRDCAMLYKSIEGGTITTLCDGVTKRIA